MMRKGVLAALAVGMLWGTTASAGAATLAPASGAFGSQEVGTTSAVKAFTLTAEVTDLNLGLAVGTTGDFKQTNDCPAVLVFLLTPSCTINVTFAPTATGTRTGALNTSSVLGAGPTAPLSGTGTSRSGSGGPGSGGGAKKKCKKKGRKHEKRAAAAKKKGKKCNKKGKGKKKH
jgi:hypothetical protein